MAACRRNNKYLFLLIDLLLNVSVGIGMTWVPWGPGYRIGISSETAQWSDIASLCGQYNAVPPEKDVQIDTTSAEFHSFIEAQCPKEQFCWTGLNKTEFSSCYALGVGILSNTYYELFLICSTMYRYICYGPDIAETTENVEPTTLPDTTLPDTTVEPTTLPDTTVEHSTIPVTTVSRSTLAGSKQANSTQEDNTQPEKIAGSSNQSTVAIATETLFKTNSERQLEGITGTFDNAISASSITSVTGIYSGISTGSLLDLNSFTELSWNQWTPWSICSSSCNGGQKLRLTLCAGKLECRYQLTSVSNITISYEIQWSICNIERCPVDGMWLSWSEWSQCSATCGLGTRHRNRFCNGPYYGGLECDGDRQENQYCDGNKACPGKLPESPVQEETFTESDSRPSAIGVGVVSLAFVLIELALVLIMDSVTIAQFCRQRLRRKQYDH